jgi:membrane protein
MKERLRLAWSVLKTTGDRFSDLEGFRLGAAFSFYATFSIFPLVLLAVTIVGFVLGDDAAARERMLTAVAAPDTPIRDVLEEALVAMQENRGARGTSFVVGVGTLLFGASGALIELDTTLNRIWGIPPRRGSGVVGTVVTFLKDRLTGFALVAGIGVTMLASLVLSSVLGAVAHAAETKLTPALLQTAELIGSIALLSGVLAAAFHLVPRSRPPLADVAPGAVLTSVLLAVLRAVFASYLSSLTQYSAYGVAGGVLALATWIFMSSQVIFFGALLTRVYCEVMGCPAARARSVPLPGAAIGA